MALWADNFLAVFSISLETRDFSFVSARSVPMFIYSGWSGFGELVELVLELGLESSDLVLCDRRLSLLEFLDLPDCCDFERFRGCRESTISSSSEE